MNNINSLRTEYPCYPQSVLDDLADGFAITDADDGFQRFKQLSPSVFHYRCEIHEGETCEAIIDIGLIDQQEAIEGFFDSIDDIYLGFDEAAPRIIGECAFKLANHYHAPIIN